jgi:hypothetical protein
MKLPMNLPNKNVQTREIAYPSEDTAYNHSHPIRKSSFHLLGIVLMLFNLGSISYALFFDSRVSYPSNLILGMTVFFIGIFGFMVFLYNNDLYRIFAHIINGIGILVDLMLVWDFSLRGMGWIFLTLAVVTLIYLSVAFSCGFYGQPFNILERFAKGKNYRRSGITD